MKTIAFKEVSDAEHEYMNTYLKIILSGKFMIAAIANWMQWYMTQFVILQMYNFLEFVTGMKQKKDKSLDAVNELDLADALEKLKSNDANLTNLNVNNHKDINELNAIETIIDCLPNNTHLKVLCMANTQMHDRHAKVRMLFSFK